SNVAVKNGILQTKRISMKPEEPGFPAVSSGEAEEDGDGRGRDDDDDPECPFSKRDDTTARLHTARPAEGEHQVAAEDAYGEHRADDKRHELPGIPGCENTSVSHAAKPPPIDPKRGTSKDEDRDRGDHPCGDQ